MFEQKERVRDGSFDALVAKVFLQRPSFCVGKASEISPLEGHAQRPLGRFQCSSAPKDGRYGLCVKCFFAVSMLVRPERRTLLPLPRQEEGGDLAFDDFVGVVDEVSE